MSHLHHHRSRRTAVSESELSDLRDAFELFDTEKKGKIVVGELLSVIKELENEKRRSTALRLQSVLLQDLHEDDELSLDSFIELFTTPNPSDSRDEMTKVFDLFDENRKGYITASDLRQVADQLGESFSDDDLNTMIQIVNKSGKVTMEQFTELMRKKL